MAETADVIIIGGGVIGCATAYELAGSGLRVTLLERGTVGGEASSASAGLIVPLHATERGQRTPLFDFYWASLRLFPGLVAELEGATGMRLEYDPLGPVRVAVTDDEEARLRESFDGWSGIEGVSVEWVDGKALRDAEPGLGPEVRCGVISHDEPYLHPGRLTEALARAAVLRGAEVRAACPALGVRQRGGRFAAVHTPDGEVAGGELIIAAGAWSRVACGWFGVDAPIGPARGQMASVRPAARALRRGVTASTGSLLPRPDGSVHVGATVEHVGFDSRNTPEGVVAILSALPRLVPALNRATLERCWAGLRPWCADGAPAVGRLPGCEGVSLASGHFKLGITGCAITARALRALILEGRTDPLAAPFSPERFASKVERSN